MPGPLGACAYNVRTLQIEAAFYAAAYGSLDAAQSAARRYVYEANRPELVVCALDSVRVPVDLIYTPED